MAASSISPRRATVGKEWGRDFERASRHLLAYGSSAQGLLPRLDKEIQPIAEKRGEKLKASLSALLKSLRSAPPGKPLITAAEYQTRHLGQ